MTDNLDYQTMCVRAILAGPISMLPHEGLPLDGVLEYAAWKAGRPVVQRSLLQSEPNGRKPLPPISEMAVNYAIPVKRVGHKVDSYARLEQCRDNRERLRLMADANWHWACSWAEFPHGYETDMAYWNKRSDYADPALEPYVDWQGKSEKVNISAGRDKAYHMPLPLVVAPVVQWWLVGDWEGVAKLLERITHLGKKSSQGFGEVVQWQISRAAQDWSCWRDGKPMRALPATESRNGHVRRNQGLRPPYWSPQMRRLVICPNRKPSGLLG